MQSVTKIRCRNRVGRGACEGKNSLSMEVSSWLTCSRIYKGNSALIDKGNSALIYKGNSVSKTAVTLKPSA